MVSTALSYRDLQAKLKELKTQGHTLTCKLNAKHEVLHREYERVTNAMAQAAQAVLDAPAAQLYPFTSNTVQVNNNVEYRTTHLPAMNTNTAPTWLTKQHKVYIVDGVDYLPFELEQQLQGQVCELTCACASSRETKAQAAPLVQQQLRENAWNRYLSNQDPTVQQAATNGVEILKCAWAFTQGLMDGLKESNRRKQ